MIASVVRRLSRNSRRRGRRAAPGRDDAGLTLIEAIIATAIVATAVAATAAALSAASKSRFAAKERALVAEIANEVLAEAEALGCGLPPDFEGISGTDRVTRCRKLHGDSSNVSLADMDYETTRDGITFDVSIRLRWFAPGLFDELENKRQTSGDPYSGGQHLCRLRADFASGLSDPTNNDSQDKDDARQPTVLERTVTVTSKRASQRGITVTSHEAVQPPLDSSASGNTNGYMARPTGSSTTWTVNTDFVTIQDKASNPDWKYVLHSDNKSCIWFPFLQQISYFTALNNGTVSQNDDLANNCPKSTAATNPSSICYLQHLL